MNKINIEIETKENYTQVEINKLYDIFNALVSTGGLLGMKNGSTSIHFDKNGDFKAIKLDYCPFIKRNPLTE